MGTAQQEIPVATFKVASFDVSLTRQEVWRLTWALEALLREESADDPCEVGILLEEFKKITEL